MSLFWLFGQFLVALVLAYPPEFADLPAAQKANLKEFHRRVDEYVRLQRRIKKEQPNIKKQNDASQLAAHRQAMAESIRAARAQARQGDIFFEEIKPYFVQLVHSELKGVKGSPARQMIKEGNPKVEKKPLSVGVNAIYPDGIPLSAVPPGLLRKLPVLPPELDYRFVGRDLILRDVDANIIVDYVLEAAPLG